jgi:hypothetical protein
MARVALEVSSFPYPGLRPFDIGETDIFFGRERQTDELLGKLQQHRFLAVVGPSGCGKSSLVLAGLIPALKTGFMADAGSRWTVARLRPGDHPMKRLAEALIESQLLGEERAALPEAALLTEAALRRGPLGLIELARESHLEQLGSLLILVDQFEELFRFRAHGDSDEADAFVALLLASAAQADLRIYVTITMRSDFLGNCAVFHGLPEAINQGQYLTPRLTREECAAAITGPARVFGGDLEPALVNQLLNDFGPDPDQLPLLQHALTRMWNARDLEHRKSGTPLLLTAGDYRDIGGLSRALSDHADEVLGKLGPAEQRIAEVMFRCLSDPSSGKTDTRAAATVATVAAVAQVDPAAVIAVADAFRAPGRCFLCPRAGKPLKPDDLLDVSHESLLRQWRTLAAWVEAEAKDVALYRRIKEAAITWNGDQRSSDGLWRARPLERALEWQAKAHPTPAWACRHGTAQEFSLVREFLEQSELARRAEQARLEAERNRELRRTRRIAVASSATAAALLCAIVAYLFMYRVEHKAHFRDYAKVYGVPQGIDRLTTAQVRHSPRSVRIVTAGWFGPVKRMEVVDADGQLTAKHGIGTYLQADTGTPTSSTPAWWEYGYDSRGRIANEMAFGERGQRVSGLIYVPPERDSLSPRTVYYVGSDGLPSSAAESSAGITIEYTKEGFESKTSYRGPGGEPVPGRDKAFAQVTKRGHDGRVTALVSLDRQGQRMNDEFGNAELRVTYDERGNEVKAVAFDASGRPTTTVQGWARRDRAYDEFGNQVGEAYYDEAGKPTVGKDRYHQAKLQLDHQGYAVETHYFGAGGEPAVDGYGCYGYRDVRDARHRVVTTTCLGPGPGGTPTADKRGCASWKMRYDDQDHVVLKSYFDAADRPTVNTDGFASVALKYDAQGDLRELTYLGLDDKPVLSGDGYAGWREQYDQSHHPLQTSYLGSGLAPVAGTKGYATIIRKYDEHGHEIEERYLGADGKPALAKDGYAGLRRKYDERGNQIEISYFGLAGQTVLSQDGYAGWSAEYDDVGNKVKVNYFGLEREAISTAGDGVAGWYSKYDNCGHEIERRYFDPHEQPATDVQGAAGWRVKYDAHGNETDTEYFNIAGRPALRSWTEKSPKPGEGYARLSKQFDARGQVIEENYFGIHGERIKNRHGWARALHGYDDRGNEVQTRYFGTKDQPVPIAEGYHAVRTKHDLQGNGIELAYFGTDGETPVRCKDGYSRVARTYDPFGRVVDESVLGPNGEATVLANGVHKSHRTYDERGRLAEEQYFGTRGEPILDGTGVHREKHQYDARGHEAETRYFGLHAEPVVSREQGCAIRRFHYDDRGNLQEWLCLDTTERLSPDKDGRARVEVEYDRRGELLGIAYFKPSGEALVTKDGYARIRHRYDDLSRRIETAYLNAGGELVALRATRVALYRYQYDSFGNQTEQSFYGAKDEPVMSSDGYHRLVEKFDARRQPVAIETYDTNNRLVLNHMKFARVASKYDASGNLTETAAYGPDGNLSTVAYGFARKTQKHDDSGNLIEEAYFGAHDQPVDHGSGARITFAYDGQGNATEVSYLGAGGKPKTPVAKLVRTYNAQRQLVEERSVGPKGQPVLAGGTFGQHITRYEYDAFGNKVSERYFDLHDRPTRGGHGRGPLCLQWRGEYDAHGKLTKQACQ